MTRLPEKALLDGSKLPKTTTGEMKDALGKLRDYLSELLGEDSSDREAARLALGIDLAELGAQLASKPGRAELDAQLESKPDRAELETRTRALEEDIAKRGVPVGSVHYFAMPEPPAGYLKCDGAAVGRDTYPELFSAIGTTFGAGDGETTFNLPDMIGRFAEGSLIPGTVKEAGLPELLGSIPKQFLANNGNVCTGVFSDSWSGRELGNYTSGPNWNIIPNGGEWYFQPDFKASKGNSTYGKSNTVQPPALTLLPCIKAFNAAVNA